MFTPYASRGHLMVSSAEKEKGIPIWDFRNLGFILFQRKKRLPGFEIFDDCGWAS